MAIMSMVAHLRRSPSQSRSSHSLRRERSRKVAWLMIWLTRDSLTPITAANLLEIEFFVIVKRQYELLPLGQLIDGFDQPLFERVALKNAPPPSLRSEGRRRRRTR